MCSICEYSILNTQYFIDMSITVKWLARFRARSDIFRNCNICAIEIVFNVAFVLSHGVVCSAVNSNRMTGSIPTQFGRLTLLTKLCVCQVFHIDISFSQMTLLVCGVWCVEFSTAISLRAPFSVRSPDSLR